MYKRRKSKFRIYGVALEMVGEVAVVARQVARHDRDLARQMRKSSTSVPLNINEGKYRRGGNRVQRYETAMGEAAETEAAIESAAAAGYIEMSGLDGTLDKLDHIQAVMWKLTH